jgi:pyridoxal phosphate enzyme (YggS family)
MIKDKIEQIRERIAQAAQRRCANTTDVTLIAVTKTFPGELAAEAISAGVKDIGESRIQEAQAKFETLGVHLTGVRRHLIGHLQTNKAKKAVELFDLIQSVDSWRLAAEIDRQAAKLNKVQDCLVEIKVSDEATKFGLQPAELPALVRQAETQLHHVRIRGLMTMAPYSDDPELARPFFRRAKAAFDGVRSSGEFPWFTILSMGMSNDFEVAVEEGATIVRVGTAIFGER